MVNPKQFATSITGITAAILVALNVIQWWLTSDDPGWDGIQYFGYPLPVYGWGGIGGYRFLNIKAAVINSALAGSVLWCVYWSVYKGVELGPRRFWTKLRRWGTSLDDK